MRDWSRRTAGLEQSEIRAMTIACDRVEGINMAQGVCDTGVPEAVRRGAQRAMDRGLNTYSRFDGLAELREAIAEKAAAYNGLLVDPETEITVSAGATGAFHCACLALLNPGDEVVLFEPYYGYHVSALHAVEAVPRLVPTRPPGWTFSPADLDRAITPRTAAIVVNSPGNPSGKVFGREELEAIAEVVRRRDLLLFTDEIYEYFLYDGRTHVSPASLPGMAERTIICDGFSKTYAMTGWRLGYGIMPRALAERVELLLTHSVGCTASFTQIAGIEAIEGPQEQVDAVVAEYKRRRDALVSGLNEIPGVRCRMPQGAFYVFPNVSAFGYTSDWLAEYLLEEAGVAVLPGTSFGKNGEGYLRLCFANSLENILQALGRMRLALGKLKGGGA